MCRTNLNVTIGVDRSGLVGADGETHHGVFDIPFLAHIPNMTICMPKDSFQAQQLLFTCMEYEGPVAIKYPRGDAYFKKVLQYSKYAIGTWEYELHRNCRDVIITFGPHVVTLSEYIEKHGLAIDVINALFIKPLNKEFLQDLFKQKKNIYVYEESIKTGGLHSMILQYANECGFKGYIGSFAIDDKFVLQGDIASLLKEQGLDYETVTAQIMGRDSSC